MKYKIFKNKKAFLSRDYIVILLVFSALIGLCYILVASMGEDYGNPNIIDENFRDNYQNLQNSTDTVSSMFNQTSSKEGMSFVGTYTSLFRATFGVISLVFSSFGIIQSQTAHFATDFGIPSAVANIIFPTLIAIITVLIIFIIISSMSKGKI